MLEIFQTVITPFNRERTIRVYLPNNYYTSQKVYPVLYMHDGQNLFQDETASYGVSWGIKDYLEENDIDLIVIGVDCNQVGFGRLDEYGPWVNHEIGKRLIGEDKSFGGEGVEYIDYIANELKPFIDEKYRTLRDKTFMAGSSMGGLISTYAACRYPHIFKRIASVSSAYWFSQKELEQLIINSDLSLIEKFYLDTGTNESPSEMESKEYIDSSNAIHRLLVNKIQNVTLVLEEGAEHNESAWRKRVPSILNYLLED